MKILKKKMKILKKNENFEKKENFEKILSNKRLTLEY